VNTPIAGIDHVLIGVRDLQVARSDYERLGFTLTPRGSHIGWGTANYCIMFARDYLELLGIVDARAETNNLDKFLAVREGLMGVAFATGDAAAAAEELRARGIAARGPEALARRLELAEGTVLPRFSLVRTPPEATPGLSAFLCQHLAPELLRRPEWLAHPNGAESILAVAAIVERPAELAASYARLLGREAIAAEAGRLVVRAGAQRIEFMTAGDFAEQGKGRRPLPGIAPPYLVSMTLGVRDLAAAAGCLAGNGVAHGREVDGAILVRPEEARGLWMRLVKAS